MVQYVMVCVAVVIPLQSFQGQCTTALYTASACNIRKLQRLRGVTGTWCGRVEKWLIMELSTKRQPGGRQKVPNTGEAFLCRIKADRNA